MQTLNQCLAGSVPEAAGHARGRDRRQLRRRRAAADHRLGRRRGGQQGRADVAPGRVARLTDGGGNCKPICGRRAARSRRGQEGRDGGRQRGGCRTSGCKMQLLSPVDGEEEAASSSSFTFGTGVDDQGRRHLHAPVRDDDRRRPAARAVPRHPVAPGRQQGVREGAGPGQGAASSGLDLPTRSRSTPRSSTSSSSTWSRPARSAASSTRILNRLADLHREGGRS